MDENSVTFVIHITFFNLALEIRPDKVAQIAFLLTKFLEKYLNFANIFSKEKALVLSEHTELNEHAINLENGKQPPYGPINSLGLVELEILKTYIKTHLKTGFIRPSKSPTNTLILFDKKPNGNLHLRIDYWGFINLTIKNWYLLPLIRESLNRLSQVKRFIQLNSLVPITKWGSRKVTSRRRLFKPDTVTLSAKWCRLVYLIP